MMLIEVRSCSDDGVDQLLHLVDKDPFVHVLEGNLTSVLLQVTERKISVGFIPGAFSKREFSDKSRACNLDAGDC